MVNHLPSPLNFIDPTPGHPNWEHHSTSEPRNFQQAQPRPIGSPEEYVTLVLVTPRESQQIVLGDFVSTQGLQSSSFLGVPLFLVWDSNILPQKELLWSLRVEKVHEFIPPAPCKVWEQLQPFTVNPRKLEH